MVYSNMPKKWFFCRNIEEWHDWLENNHFIEKEVWLQIKKVGTNEVGINLEGAVEEAICYGWIDSRMYRIDDQKYILRFSPRKPGIIWSVVNKNRAERIIAEGRMTEAGMKAVEEAKLNGMWESAYSSRIEPDTPSDLLAALAEDPVALKNFISWPNSYRFQVIYWLEKSVQKKTRENRIRKVVQSASANKKMI